MLSHGMAWYGIGTKSTVPRLVHTMRAAMHMLAYAHRRPTSARGRQPARKQAVCMHRQHEPSLCTQHAQQLVALHRKKSAGRAYGCGLVCGRQHGAPSSVGSRRERVRDYRSRHGMYSRRCAKPTGPVLTGLIIRPLRRRRAPDRSGAW